MSARELRRQQDRLLLEALVERSKASLSLTSDFAPSSDRFTLNLALPTAANQFYPAQVQTNCALEIVVPFRYPFEPPLARCLSSIWHPNVFANGNVCLGTRWQASEGLDLFVARVARLLIFDPLLVNLNSAANQAAARWYRQALAASPQSFPTVQAHVSHWLRDPRGVNPAVARVQVKCPSCQKTLGLPSGRQGLVRCPQCRQDFEAST